MKAIVKRFEGAGVWVIQAKVSSNQGRRQLCEIGGEAKLKSGGQRFSPKCEGFFWPKSQIFRPNAGDLHKKKKVFAKIRGFFLAEIANFNVFSAQKHQLFPKKYRGGARKKSGSQKRKSGGQKRKSGGHSPPAGDAPGSNAWFS